MDVGLGVYVIPALGRTAEKKVGVAAVPSLAWSADSRSLVISRSPAAKEPPGLAMLSDRDGPGDPTHIARRSTIRLARGYGAGRKDLGVSTLSGPSECRDSDAPYPTAAPAAGRGVETDRPRVFVWGGNFAWSGDGREIIYSRAPGRSLWRIAHSGDSPPERLSSAGEGARDPATAARRSNRLVFSRAQNDDKTSGRWSSTKQAVRKARPSLPSSPRGTSSVRPSRRMEPKSRSSRIVPAATRCGSAGATVRTVHR